MGMSFFETGARIDRPSAPWNGSMWCSRAKSRFPMAPDTHRLTRWDSCRIGPNETRIVRNTSQAGRDAARHGPAQTS